MERFDDNWRFGRADDASQPDFDDSTWRSVYLPHDWSIEDLPPSEDCPRRTGPFDPDLSGGKGATGHFVGGVAWYRKRFVLKATEHAEVQFEGAYCTSDVWLNGNHLGTHVHGYTPFNFDMTPFLKVDGENVLAVRVANVGSNSRWYTGSGLYRHVWLKESGAVFIPMDGVFVTTPTVESGRADVHVDVEILNSSNREANGDVCVDILDPSGALVTQHITEFRLKPGSHGVCQFNSPIVDPQIWDLSSPALYTVTAQVMVGGCQSDSVVVSFGVRDVKFTVDEGFLLNGRSVKIKGGCVHHDNGLLGAAAIERAEYRRIELLKAAGYNGIRTSHNASSAAFLDACDKLGLVVMDEAFDEWQHPKTPDGYSKHFADTSDSVLTSQVRRDRNHPSVVMWSIGNEIPECFQETETALRLRNTILASDPTRAISQGICASFFPGFPWTDWQTSSEPAFLHLDVCGYNYQHENYELDHARFPERIVVGTESFPKDIFDIWKLVEQHSWLIGDFTWTAMDYFGESGIGHTKFGNPEDKCDEFPLHMAICGDLNILGNRKPASYYRQAQWERGIIYIVVGQEPEAQGWFDRLDSKDWRPKWGWPNVQSHWSYSSDVGLLKNVYVYSSCDLVRLYLNGKMIGDKPTGLSERRLAAFEVPYEPGELTAVGLFEGREIEHRIMTAGPPAGLRITVDRHRLDVDRNDLSYLAIEVVDSSGVVVPGAVNDVELVISGPAELAAFGNADPYDASSVQIPRHQAWRGVLQAIIRPTGARGTVHVSAESENLEACSVQIEIGGI